VWAFGFRTNYASAVLSLFTAVVLSLGIAVGRGVDRMVNILVGAQLIIVSITMAAMRGTPVNVLNFTGRHCLLAICGGVGLLYAGISGDMPARPPLAKDPATAGAPSPASRTDDGSPVLTPADLVASAASLNEPTVMLPTVSTPLASMETVQLPTLSAMPVAATASRPAMRAKASRAPVSMVAPQGPPVLSLAAAAIRANARAWVSTWSFASAQMIVWLRSSGWPAFVDRARAAQYRLLEWAEGHTPREPGQPGR